MGKVGLKSDVEVAEETYHSGGCRATTGTEAIERTAAETGSGAAFTLFRRANRRHF